MYKRKKVKKLGRTKSHRDALIINQLRSLFRYGYVKTTTSKAKVLKAEAEKLIFKYSNDLSFRRRLRIIFNDKKLVDSFVKYAEKGSKGVKISKVGFRSGDMEEVSKVELVNFNEKKVVKEQIKEDGKKKRKKREVKKEIRRKIPRMEEPEISIKENEKVKRERVKTRSGL